MVALNTLYQLNVRQRLGGQEIQNVFFYNHIAGDGLATDLALAFEADVLDYMRGLQVHALEIYGIQAFNLGDYTDFVTLPLADTGNYGDVDYLPSYVAVGYTYKLNTRAIKSGSKRIAGVPEEVTAGNSITDAGYITGMEALRTHLLANVVSGGDTWQPVVIKRVKTAIPGTTPVKYRYSLPVSPAEAEIGNVVQVLTSNTLTSQVSRKA